jgi:site-specific recombinase XerD
LQQEAERIALDTLQIFLNHLENKGYASKTIRDYLGSILHFSRWLREKGKTLDETTVENEIRFLTNHLSRCRCPQSFPRNKSIVRAALHRWSDVFGMKTMTSTLIDEHAHLTLQFDDYLANVTGLSVSTRLYRCRHALEFLQSIGLRQLTTLTQLKIATYLHQRTCHLAPTSGAAIACSINQFLQFISSLGHVAINIAARASRPKVAYTGPTTRALSDNEFSDFLNAFDRTYPMGKRDYAMARCLSDLGIRTSDVSALQLDDIDWQHSIVTFRQCKSRKRQKLPMPETLIDSLVDYLCHARPKTNERSVFVYHRAPRGEAVQPSTVRGAIRRAFARANFSASDSQVHRLRHTMATRLLQNGQTIKTIADILGHQCIDTTIRYTTIDRQALRRVALPWPERIAS